MPSKAGMWRQGAVGGDVRRPQRRQPRVSGRGNARVRKRNETRPGIFAFVCEITRIPPNWERGECDPWVLRSFQCGGSLKIGGSRFRLPPQVGEVLDYDKRGPPQWGPRVGDMCVTQIALSGVRGVSGVDTSVTGTYMSYVHTAGHTCS
jgi:hypothetical protein